MLPSQPKTFCLENCRDVHLKLEWEIKQLKDTDPEDVDELCYRAYNAAVTAWHLTDWVWAEMTQEQKDALVAEKGLPITTLGEFQTLVRDECRDLHICRQVCTASKHREVTIYPDNTVDTAVSAASRFGGDSDCETDTHAAPTWILKVTDGANRRPAIDVFERALGYWDKFIYQRGISR